MTDWVERQENRSKVVEMGADGIRYDGYFARWDQVYGTAYAGLKKFYVLLAMKPPRPPWMAVSSNALPEGCASFDELAAMIDARRNQGSYRAAPRRHPRLNAEQLLAEVLDRNEIPGALEVPIGFGPGGTGRRIFEITASGLGGATTLGVVGLFAGPVWPLAAVGFGAGAAYTAWKSHTSGRVLVLAPDGCVVGFPSGVRCFSWDEIESFSIFGGHALDVRLQSKGETEKIDASWFAAPLPLIRAVAEAFRQNVQRTMR